MSTPPPGFVNPSDLLSACSPSQQTGDGASAWPVKRKRRVGAACSCMRSSCAEPPFRISTAPAQVDATSCASCRPWANGDAVGEQTKMSSSRSPTDTLTCSWHFGQ
eukprot:208019-Pleurochrysis_carterae.AAC.1